MCRFFVLISRKCQKLQRLNQQKHFQNLIASFSWNSVDDEAAGKYDHILDNDKHFEEDSDRNRTISRIIGQDFETELQSVLKYNVIKSLSKLSGVLCNIHMWW